MKMPLLLTGALLLAISMDVLAQAPVPKPSGAVAPATLICRMGGDMNWSLVNQFDVVSAQVNGKNVRLPVIVALFDQLLFKKSGVPVKPDASNLEPGVCGWPDRAMSAAEPGRVIAESDDFMLQSNVRWGNGSTVGGGTTMFGGSLSFQNKQAFSMQVTLLSPEQFKVVSGTKPKALSK